MKTLIKGIIFFAISCLSVATLAQNKSQDLVQDIQLSTLSLKLQIESLRAETNRLRKEKELQASEAQKQEIAERTEQTLLKQIEMTKTAEEATNALRNEILQAKVSAQNNAYLGILLLLTSGCIIYIVKKSKKEIIMLYNQKFGILTIIISILFIILSVMISNGWQDKIDILQNLISSLHIQIFLTGESDYSAGWSQPAYYIDIPTKYFILVCICLASYGLTTYLGITSAPKILQKKITFPKGDSNL